ncbi:hypothetical protein PR048_000126 [Dryococelus australis]|uniref:Uncharacterized protein n=1 Tax=Dryococelus australis TaxID=614101 RepID=A0ABQ9IEY0_9NEOP|nr:hypothetical protein PR048_000126 [Dryococelus australis]
MHGALVNSQRLDIICKSQNEGDLQSLPKLGKPFAELEQRLLKYIITMQELGFGLSAIAIRYLLYHQRRNTLSTKNRPLANGGGKIIKADTAFSLRIPENIAAYRSSMANREILNYFYENLESLLVKLGLEDRPDQIWNCDETGGSYVVRAFKNGDSNWKKICIQKELR